MTREGGKSTMGLGATEREAHAWVRRLTSGEATVADADAFQLWRQQSAAHATAFANASKLWETVGSAGDNLRYDPVSLGALLDGEAKRVMTRRLVLRGGLATAAVAAGVVALHPPLALWPSWSELAADYRTGTGEQRKLALSDSVSINLDTRTSIALRPDHRDTSRIELISGQASIATPPQLLRPVTVIASSGQTVTTQASFDVRYLGAEVRVTCLGGEVRVEHQGNARIVRERQQVAYDARRMSDIVAIDPAVEAAWQEGLLIFRYTPLPKVVEEVNRYRSGRIFVVNAELNTHLINGRFHIDRIDEVLVQLEQAFGVKAKTLPGGIVLLS
ncbi:MULTISPECIES: FecR family protein [unclassified Bradyrhizobium]